MNENANPLTMSLDAIDTSMPLLAAALYELRIAKITVEPVRNGSGKLINLTLETINPATSSTGDVLNPGVKVFDRINLQPSGKSTWAIVGQSIARFIQAAAFDPKPYGSDGMAQINAADQWAPTLVGRIVKAKVDVDPETLKDGKTYRAKNSIAYYVK